MVLYKAFGFYKEPSPTEEPFFHLRHLYRFFEEPWFERFFVEPEMVPKDQFLRFFKIPL